MAERFANRTLAVVNGSSSFSGITQSVQPYVPVLNEVGFDVRWYQCTDRGSDVYHSPNGVVVRGVGLPFESLEMGVNRLWVFPRRLRGISERLMLITDPTLAQIARHREERSVVMVHDLLPLTPHADRIDSHWMFRFVLPLLRRVRRVIVPTHSMHLELAQRGISSNRIREVPQTHFYGMHPEHTERSLSRIQSERELRALYIATDRPFKNIRFYFQLAKAAMAHEQGVNVRFTLLSRLKPSTSTLLSKMGLDNVRIVSQVPSVASLYAAHDVLVYPSLHEGFGRPVIEAMSFGLPVLTNHIPPFTETIGSSGLLLPARDLDAWLGALLSLIEPGRYGAYSRRSLERATLFQPEQFNRVASEAFRDLVDL